MEPICPKCSFSLNCHHTQTGACPKRLVGNGLPSPKGFYDAQGELHVDANEICRALGWPETEENVDLVMSQVQATFRSEMPDAEFVVKNHHPDAAAAGLVIGVVKIVREFHAQQN